MVKQRMIRTALLALTFLVSICCGLSSAQNSDEAGRLGYPDSVSVGMRVDFPPYAYVNEYGRADGFSAEILHEAASLMGLTLNVRMGPIEKLKASLLNGEIDILVGLEHTDETAGMVRFGQPHTIVYDAIFFQNGGTRFEEVADLKKRRLVVVENDIAHRFLKSAGISENIRTVETIAEALRLVTEGKAEASLVPLHSAEVIIDKYNISGLAHSQYPLTQYHRSLAFASVEPSGDKLAIFEQGLSLMRTNGAYDRIFNKWFGPYHPNEPGSARVIRYALIAGIILTALLSGIMTWAMYLRRKNALRTRQLAREINARDAAMDELRVYRNRMEELIDSRTADLREKLVHYQNESSQQIESMSDLEQKYAGLERAFEISGCGKWSYNIDRGTVSWDSRVSGMLDMDEVEGNPSLEYFIDKFGHNDAFRFRRALSDAANGRGGFEIVLRRPIDDAAVQIYLISGKAVEDGTGRANRIDGTIKDITELSSIQRDWQEAHDDLQELSDSHVDPMIVLDQEMVVTRCNPAAEKLLQRDRCQLIGRHFFDMVCPELEKTALAEHLRNVIENRSAVRFETFMERDVLNDWFDIKVYPYRDGAAVSFSIITERKEAELELAESERKYRDIIGNIPDPLAVVSAFDDRIVYINREFCEAFGYSTEKIMTRPLRDLEFWRDIDNRNRFYAEIKAGGKVSEFEAPLNMRNEQETTCLLSCRSLVLDNQRHHIIMFKSIETQKRHELMLERRNHIMNVMTNIDNRILRAEDIYCLLSSITGQLKNELKYDMVRLTVIDDKLKPAFGYLTGKGDSIESVQYQGLDADLPKCCRKLLFTDENCYTVSKSEDCPECRFVSETCPGQVVTFSMRNESRIKGFIQISDDRFGIDDIDDFENTGQLSAKLAQAIENDESERRRRKEDFRNDERRELIAKLSKQFKGDKAHEKGSKYSEGLRLLTQFTGADLGIIVAIGAENRLCLFNEWHENGLSVDSGWFADLDRDCLGHLEMTPCVIQELDHCQNGLEKMLNDKLGVSSISIHPMRKEEAVFAAIVLVSKNDHIFQDERDQETLDAAADIFANAYVVEHFSQKMISCRDELDSLMKSISKECQYEKRVPDFAFEMEELTTSALQDNTDTYDQIIDMNNLVDEILSDLYYAAREKEISLVRKMDLPAVQGKRLLIQRYIRGIIDRTVESINKGSRPVIEIGYDNYIISPRGKIGGFFLKNSGGEFALEDGDRESGIDFVEIWHGACGNGPASMYISLPLAESSSLVLSGGHALVSA